MLLAIFCIAEFNCNSAVKFNDWPFFKRHSAIGEKLLCILCNISNLCFSLPSFHDITKLSLAIASYRGQAR